MIIGIGLDILEFQKLNNILSQNKQSFLKKVYTSREINYAKKAKWIESLASTFAAKEAVFKAISDLGLKNICFQEIEIVRNNQGKPKVILSGNTKKIVDKKGHKILLSLTSCSNLALAQAVVVSSIQSKDK